MIPLQEYHGNRDTTALVNDLDKRLLSGEVNSWSQVSSDRIGFCCLLHLLEGVAGFTLCSTTVIMRYVPPAVSFPIFPLHHELLKEIGPELKHVFVRFCLETGHRQIHRELPKASSRFLNIIRTLESGETTRWMGIRATSPHLLI